MLFDLAGRGIGEEGRHDMNGLASSTQSHTITTPIANRDRARSGPQFVIHHSESIPPIHIASLSFPGVSCRHQMKQAISSHQAGVGVTYLDIVFLSYGT